MRNARGASDGAVSGPAREGRRTVKKAGAPASDGIPTGELYGA